jgi:hypothetical protein
VILQGEHRTRQLIEAAGALAVLAGLVALIRVFIVDGYLPAPFVFDTYDTFMDWFHTAYWAHRPGAYSVWQTIYLPLSFVITGLFADPRCYANSAFDARECDLIGITFLVLTFVAAAVVSGIAFYRRDRSTALFRTIAVAAGGPLLFSLERGNTILLAYIAFVLLYGGLLKSRAGIALAAGFLANMKIYLIFPLAAFAIKRKWRTLEVSCVAALVLYLVSLLLVGAGTPFELARNINIWLNSFAISVWDQIVYSTTYQPYLLLDVLQYPVRDFLDQRTVDFVKTAIEWQVLLSRAVALLCIAAAWFYPGAVSLRRLVFFVLMQSFMGQNPGGYAITFIVFLIFMEDWKNWGTAIALVCAYLVSIPTDLALATILEVDRTSWLSGRMIHVEYVLTLGSLLRPGLLAIALWALAIDSLLSIHRAVKAGPPLPGLAFQDRIEIMATAGGPTRSAPAT